AARAVALPSPAVALDRLLPRLADGLLAHDEALDDLPLPDFPLAKEIYARGPLGAPFFWGRFDMFERMDGGLAALEYNCDKPAGQREIWAAEELGPARGNLNRGARARFRAVPSPPPRAGEGRRGGSDSPSSAIRRIARSSVSRICSGARPRHLAGRGTWSTRTRWASRTAAPSPTAVPSTSCSATT